jgi:hypothetical protein
MAPRPLPRLWLRVRSSNLFKFLASASHRVKRHLTTFGARSRAKSPGRSLESEIATPSAKSTMQAPIEEITTLFPSAHTMEEEESGSEESIRNRVKRVMQRIRDRHDSTVHKVAALSTEHTATAISLKPKLTPPTVHGDESRLPEHDQSSPRKTSRLHPPLPGHDYIRLLKLDPGVSLTADLHAQLLVVPVKEAPIYEALSYTWGKPIFTESLHLPNGVLKITENLNSALRQFRLAAEPRMLWVDAVCIDQVNADEKSHQAAFMPQIYSAADKVLCWLGSGTDDTKHAIRNFKRLAVEAEGFGISKDEWSFNYEGIKLECGHSDIQDLMRTQSSYGLHAIYSRPWFSRLWVV